MSIDTGALKATLMEGLARSTTVRDFGAQGALVMMPQTFSGGTILSLLVTDEGGFVTVSDRGLTADHLDLANVDISRGTAKASWDAVRTSAGVLPAMGAEEWELTAAGGRENLAALVQAVADTALRAEGLTALSKSARTRTFAESVVNTFGAGDLPVIPRAPIAGRFGHARQVTCLVNVDAGFWVQACGGSDSDARTTAHDRATAVFSAAVPPKDRRIAVLQGSEWASWQVNSLREHARVTVEDELVGLVAELAARA